MATTPMVDTTGEPLEFDPFSSAFFRDPTDIYRRLRDEAPVYFSERYGFWALVPLGGRGRRPQGRGRLLQQLRDRPPLCSATRDESVTR